MVSVWISIWVSEWGTVSEVLRWWGLTLSMHNMKNVVFFGHKHLLGSAWVVEAAWVSGWVSICVSNAENATTVLRW